ncbi:MAG: nitroreductase family protein [Mycobacterium sp.]|nr:nitroreductase family protein [Mycobacterium sp.]
MPNHPADRDAQTRVPIHPPISRRWSPRAFDPAAVLTAAEVTGLLEAARWAATWGGRQPVRFVVGVRRGPASEETGDDTFDTLAGLLSRGNAYARAAGALILVCADEGEDEAVARYSAVDAGAAAANLAVEATARGLITHPMAGFDPDGARTAFDIPSGVRPLMVVAVGSLGDYATVSTEIAERDALPRKRRPLDEVAFCRTWGRSWPAEPGSC